MDCGISEMTLVEPISETQGVSEAFKLFSALFDGPPPASTVAIIIDDILPALREAAGLGKRASVLQPDCFAKEYERLFLLPAEERKLSPYSTNYGDEQENGRAKLIQWLLILAETLRFPWRKETFTPGRSYPVMPDHLSVEFGLLSAISLVDVDASIAGKMPQEWASTLAEELVSALEKMRNLMLGRDGVAREPGYYEVITVALKYLGAYLESLIE